MRHELKKKEELVNLQECSRPSLVPLPEAGGAVTQVFRRLRRCGLIALLCLAVLLPAELRASDNANVSVFDAPGAQAGMRRGTRVIAIDAAGDIAGVYSDANDVLRSYLRAPNGTITEFEPPVTNGHSSLGSSPVGFDAAGDLLGIYVDSSQTTHGYLLAHGATLPTAITFPSAGTGKYAGTYPLSIDAAGDVSGIYIDANGATHGFVQYAGLAPVGIDAIEPNGARGVGTYYVTVNTVGGIAGAYVDQHGVAHGFVKNSSGLVTIDAPGAGTASGDGTVAYALDDSGHVGGIYEDAAGIIHGFVYSAGATSTFDAPATSGGQSQSILPLDYPLTFDAAGDLMGSYFDAHSTIHGFVRSLAGAITTFDAPDAGIISSTVLRAASRTARKSGFGAHLRGFATRTRNLAFAGAVSAVPNTSFAFGGIQVGRTVGTGDGSRVSATVGVAMNAAGDITGGYIDSNTVAHGFLRTSAGLMTEFVVPQAGQESNHGTIPVAINSGRLVAGTYIDDDLVLHGFVAALGNAPATSTTLNADPTASVYGQPVTLTARVAAGSTTPPDGETVRFFAGTASLGTAPLNSGTAVLTTTNLPVGTNSLTAVYVGDTNFLGSTSDALNLPVGAARSNTTLSLSVKSATVGQSITFTASVSGQYGGSPTGTVTFYNGTTVLGTGSLSGGTAAWSTSSLAAATYSVTAAYGGDARFASSTSDAIGLVIGQSAVITPTMVSMSPAFTSAGGAAFSLKVTGSNFVSGSTIYWSSSALPTTFVSATQLTAQVPASSIASAGSFAVTVQTPGASAASNALQFEVDSATTGTTPPNFTTATATVTAGATANFPVSLPTTVTNISVTCLNLPAGATCSYSSTTGVTIATSASTPKGSYQITVVFTETVTTAAGAVLLPFLLLPFGMGNRKRSAAHKWILGCAGLLLLAASAFTIGCGGSNSVSSTPTAKPATTSGVVTLNIQ